MKAARKEQKLGTEGPEDRPGPWPNVLDSEPVAAGQEGEAISDTESKEYLSRVLILVEARKEPCGDLELNLLNKESSKCKRTCDKRELGVYQEDRGLEFRK